MNNGQWGSAQCAPMTAAQREEAEMSFKRMILTETRAFEQEPMADACRVSFLGQMLDRLDELTQQGMEARLAVSSVQREFRDLAQRMRTMGFEPARRPGKISKWPQLTEDEAAEYIRQSSAYEHRVSMGVALCAACCAPLMLMAAFSEVLYMLEDQLMMFGLLGMFAMIGLGVYCMVTAEKPKQDKQIRSHRFALNNRLRAKLKEMQELITRKARKRSGRGIAMLVMCVAPIFLGAALIPHADFGATLGVGGMFLLIGAGVYELCVASCEKKSVKRLLDDDDSDEE